MIVILDSRLSSNALFSTHNSMHYSDWVTLFANKAIYDVIGTKLDGGSPPTRVWIVLSGRLSRAIPLRYVSPLQWTSRCWWVIKWVNESCAFSESSFLHCAHKRPSFPLTKEPPLTYRHSRLHIRAFICTLNLSNANRRMANTFVAACFTKETWSHMKSITPLETSSVRNRSGSLNGHRPFLKLESITYQ